MFHKENITVKDTTFDSNKSQGETKLGQEGPRHEYVHHVHKWETLLGLGREEKGGTEKEGIFVAHNNGQRCSNLELLRGPRRPRNGLILFR